MEWESETPFEFFRYMCDDEDVANFKCFDTFSDAKQFYLEQLQKKVDTALKLKQKDIK
jgi:hypothetical protein